MLLQQAIAALVVAVVCYRAGRKDERKLWMENYVPADLKAIATWRQVAYKWRNNYYDAISKLVNAGLLEVEEVVRIDDPED